MRYILFPYQVYSNSARALRDRLSAFARTLIVYPDRNYRYRAGDIILNWGNSHPANWMNNESISATLNRPEFVGNASNKLTTLQRLQSAEIPVVEFTTDREVSHQWNRGGHTVYARHKLTGHSGEGIEVIRPNSYEIENPRAPLYTKAKQNHGEYRVHVFNGEVIDYRKKGRRDGDTANQAQNDVRTHGNGWIYRMDVRRVDRIMDLAKEVVETLGLNFAAVDIIKDENDDIFVLEVNTAVGLEGSTLDNYVTAITNYATQQNAS